MDIAKIDKRFDLTETVLDKSFDYYSLPNENFNLLGVFRDEKEGFIRLPQSIANQVSSGVAHLNHDTSGGRLRFKTDSKAFKIIVEYDYIWPMQHMTLVGSSGFILLEIKNGKREYVKILPPTFNDKTGYTTEINLKGDGLREYILYFPLYGRVRNLTIGLTKNAKVLPAKYKDILPIVYYGSSITQGGCASRPDSSYQAMIEKKNDIDFINLGFSGNGKGETIMANYIASIKASLYVIDFNNTVISLEELKERHFPLYKTIRDKNPDTPILILTKTNGIKDNDNLDREKIIKSTYLNAKKLGDNNIYFLSGHSLISMENAQHFLVDSDHPTDLGFYFMANRIYKKMCAIDKKFK